MPPSISVKNTPENLPYISNCCTNQPMMTHSCASKNKNLEQIPISHSFSNKLVNCERVFCWWGGKKTAPRTHFHDHIYNSTILMATKSWDGWCSSSPYALSLGNNMQASDMKAWKHQLMWEVGLVTHSPKSLYNNKRYVKLWPCQSTLKSIFWQKKNYRNSNISPCKNTNFKKSSKRNQNPSRY
jgi:hypothetical protein